MDEPQNSPGHQKSLLPAEARSGPTTISACMIVRNEEELLPGCLESIRDWVNEIVIVDTGSTDKTVEIAGAYGARVFHQPWEGDFSKHRNYSLDQATGDWVLIIDADERFVADDVRHVRRAIDEQAARVIAVNVLNVGGKFEEQVTFLPSVRLFRRELDLRYAGIVHNQLQIDPAEPVLRLGATVRHLGYGLSPEKMAAKAERTISLLDAQLADDPDNAFALFNLAQVLLGLGVSGEQERAARVIDAASRASKLTDPTIRDQRHIHVMATNQWALACFLTGDYGQAEVLAQRVLELKPNYLDPLLLLGNVYLRTQQFEAAEKFFRKYLDCQSLYREADETDDLIVMHPRSIHLAHYGLALICEQKSDWKNAKRYYRKVLERVPGFLDTNCRLGYTELRSERFDRARDCFQRQLEIDPAAHIAALGLAIVEHHDGHHVEAEKYLSAALEYVPDDSPAIVGHAESLEQAGYTVGAVRFLDKAGDGLPLPLEIRRELAAANFRLGRFGVARSIYVSLAEAGESDGNLYNDLAGSCFKLGLYEEAESYYEWAVGVLNPTPLAWRNLGLTRVHLNQPERALEALRRYSRLSENSAEIAPLMGDLCFHLERFEEAISLYEKRLQSDPANRNTLFKLAECYRHLGHHESALLGYRQVLAIDADFRPAIDRVGELSQPVHAG